MRNIAQLAVSMVLLASQVHVPALGNATAAAESKAPTAGVYEVKFNTNTASPVVIVAAKKPDYDAEVLAPLHAAQAQVAATAAAKAAATKAAATKAAAAKAAATKAKARVAVVARPAVVVPGTHADWMRAAGIAEKDFGYVDYIMDHESGWGVTKSNYGGSGAYGIGQAMPASKMAKFGVDYLTNPVTQLRWANAYAVGCYGSWSGAYSRWIARHSW